MSNSEVFVDGLLNVTLVKGMVRVDFFTLSATELQKDGQPAPEFRQRLIMNPQSLLEIYQSLQVAIMALNERGVVNMRPLPDAAQPPVQIPVTPPLPTHAVETGAPPEPAGGGARPAPRSRNFPTTMGG